MSGVVSPHKVYRINLEAAVFQERDHWIGECPAVQVVTQGATEAAAAEALREAVALWFESCIARGTLDAALTECGFRERARTASLSANHVVVSAVDVEEVAPFPVVTLNAAARRVVGLLPAELAAAQLGAAQRAVG